jgi:hypothetical protein
MLPLIFIPTANAPGPCDDIITYDTDTLIAMWVGGVIALEAAGAASLSWPALSRLSGVLRTIAQGTTAVQILSKSYKIIVVNMSPVASDKEKHQKTTALLCEILVDLIIYRLTMWMTNPLNVELGLASSMTTLEKIWISIKACLDQAPTILGWIVKESLSILSIDLLFRNQTLIGEYAAEAESGRKMLRAIEAMEAIEQADKASSAQIEKIRKSFESIKVPEYDVKDMMVGPIKIGTIQTPMIDCARQVLAERFETEGKLKRRPDTSGRPTAV